MKNKKSSLALFFFLGAFGAIVVMYMLGSLSSENKEEVQNHPAKSRGSTIENTTQSIDVLTSEKMVVPYVKENGRLPDYYISKSKAREKGWVASKGNLCEVVPGHAIGGDRFYNREKQLPQGMQYFEADINYNCGRRGDDRLIFSSSGEIWVSYDHYKTFIKK